jgi:hypothetical protein
MAVYAYWSGHLTNLHLNPAYAALKDRFGQRLKRLQYSYHDAVGHFRGGITVCDHLAERPEFTCSNSAPGPTAHG